MPRSATPSSARTRRWVLPRASTGPKSSTRSSSAGEKPGQGQEGGLDQPKGHGPGPGRTQVVIAPGGLALKVRTGEVEQAQRVVGGHAEQIARVGKRELACLRGKLLIHDQLPLAAVMGDDAGHRRIPGGDDP